VPVSCFGRGIAARNTDCPACEHVTRGAPSLRNSSRSLRIYGANGGSKKR